MLIALTTLTGRKSDLSLSDHQIMNTGAAGTVPTPVGSAGSIPEYIVSMLLLFTREKPY